MTTTRELIDRACRVGVEMVWVKIGRETIPLNARLVCAVDWPVLADKLVSDAPELLAEAVAAGFLDPATGEPAFTVDEALGLKMAHLRRLAGVLTEANLGIYTPPDEHGGD